MSDTPVVAPGQIIDGRYRVERIVGQGAMGQVVAATHLMLQKQVALKIMLGGSKATPEQEARFRREAPIAGMLKSEHAGKVRNSGNLATGEPYIEMDLLDGQDLGRVLQSRGALTVAEAVTYVLQACEAVAEAHASGVVHRDLKPANLFLAKDAADWPCIKVLDFGVSKVDQDDGKLTQTGQALGSPLYMAPEQMLGSRDVDARADVWALGGVLYELLTEVPPFVAETIMAVSARVLRDEPTPISQYRPDVPAGLSDAIMRCLRKTPADRWTNVAALAAALGPYAPAEMAAYVGRVARVQGVRIEQERPGVEPTAEPPKTTTAARSAPAGSVLAPAPGTTDASSALAARRRPVAAKALGIAGLALTVIAALALATLAVARWRSVPAELHPAGQGSVTPASEVPTVPPSSVLPVGPSSSPVAQPAATSTPEPTASAVGSGRVVPAAAPPQKGAAQRSPAGTRAPAPPAPASPNSGQYDGRK